MGAETGSDVEWDEIRAEKSVYMEELMEAVKRQTELMVGSGMGVDGAEVMERGDGTEVMEGANGTEVMEGAAVIACLFPNALKSSLGRTIGLFTMENPEENVTEYFFGRTVVRASSG